VAKPQPALFNMEDCHNFPDQSFSGFPLDSGILWDSLDYDLHDSPQFLDENGLDLEWPGQLTNGFDMSHFPNLNTQSWPEQYAASYLGDLNELQSATMPLFMTDQMEVTYLSQLRPAPLATMTPILSTSSPSETTNQSSSLTPHEERTPSPSSSTSSKKYICSICQPHRSYCTPQLLKLVSQLATFKLKFFN
jgi:hypothetical protein